jgi:uroporphyrinogen decarboxylase
MMNHKDRFLSALSMGIPDRIPVFYQHLGGARWVLSACGETIRSGYQDPTKFAKIAIKSQELFGFDNVMSSWGDLLVEAQAHGTELTFPVKDYYPRVSKYAIASIKEIDKLHPVDPMIDRLWSVQLKASEIMSESIGDDVAVVGCIDSPFVIASEVIGLERLMMSMLCDPDESEKIVSIVTESCTMYMDRIATDVGLESVFIEDGMAGGDLVSLETCQRFDLSYMKQLIDHCHSLGLKSIVHNCSAKPYIKAQVGMAPDCLHFNNKMVPLEETFQSLKGRVCVMSGIDHMELLFNGSPGEVGAEVKRVIDIFGADPGFILAPGCEMPFKTPVDNITSLARAVEEHGTYGGNSCGQTYH